MKKNTKSEFWQMRVDRTDKISFAKLKKRMKVRSEAEAIRRAVAHMLEITEPRRGDRSSPMQVTA